MRMTPRVAGAFGRVGFRATSPRRAWRKDVPGEDDFLFHGHIGAQTYKFKAKYSGFLAIGFFGRDRGASSHSWKMEATYNGRPMTVVAPTYVGSDRGIPGFVYVLDAVAGEDVEVAFTVTSGEMHTGALKVMAPPKYVPVEREPASSWSGNGGSGGGMSVSPQNVGVEQVLIVGGYGGIRTPITFANSPYSPIDQHAEWIAKRVEFVVDSTVVPGSKTSVAFAYFQTQATSCNITQNCNNFAMEPGYGMAMFRAKDMGLAPG